MNTRTFDIGDVLSITTDYLVSERGMEGVYDILNFLTGDNLFTHQLPRASQEMRPVILKQHPNLEAIPDANVTRDNWRGWLAEQVALFGPTLELSPAQGHEHERIDPLSELAEKIHPDRIIGVQL